MSAITAIDPITLDASSLPHATIPPPTLPTDQPQTTSGDAEEPAVVVSLSNEATASLQAASTTLSLDPDQVDYALSWATGINGFAANAARLNKANVAADGAHWNEADVAAEYGTAIAERGTAEVIGAAVGSPSQALYYAANLGIPILDSVSSDAVKSGAAPGTISVGAFTFTNGGSTYAVTSEANNRLIGTKDGQEWKTWQLTSPADVASSGAGAAVDPLTSHIAGQKEPDDEPLHGIDVSA
jgi:hypothetical protein